VWCVSGCPWPPARKARILAELAKWKLPLKDMKEFRPRVPKRGENSALGWLPEIARPLAEYLAGAIGEKADGVRVYRMTARVLALAADDRRVTTEALKARLLRARDLK
jgi:hypothetical protein